MYYILVQRQWQHVATLYGSMHRHAYRLTISLQQPAIFSAAEDTVQVGLDGGVYLPVRPSQLQAASVACLGGNQRSESCKANQ